MRLYKEKNKQSSAVVQKTLINSEYLLGQFQRRCNNPQYQERIKLQIILTIAKKQHLAWKTAQTARHKVG